MAKRQRTRAVRRVTDLVENLIITLAEIGDELAAIDDEIADEAYLGTAQGGLASAKESQGGGRCAAAMAERGRGQRRRRGRVRAPRR